MLKLIQTRLRSTMEDERLESLMTLSCEADISIDYGICYRTIREKIPRVKELVLY